jgi:4-diphosphocytidyl-2-C-methyl-D-erythritol kinase
VALRLPAFAKLNLTLDVLGRRPDGYHDIDSVMQSISLHDLLSIERTDCRVFEAPGPAIEGENLVLKAARELEGHVGRDLPFTIRLFKRIPIGAGLGGGSSDAAALLRAANYLYGLRLTTVELADVAERVGKDIPFFLQGGTARATGLGSTVQALPPLPAAWRFLVVCPPIQVSTHAVYEAVDGRQPSAHRTPAFVSALPESLSGASIPPSPGTGEGWGGGNDLEPVTRRLFPAFDEALDRLGRTIPGLTMSGTGAAVFAVYDNRRDAQAALESARNIGYPAWLCHPVGAL